MSVRRPLWVEETSLMALVAEVDKRRAELGEHVVLSISHAVAPTPESSTGLVYSAVLLVELPG
jgi:hypothetical protein